MPLLWVAQALGAQALSLPIIVTEQYPKALGATVVELKELLPADFMYVDKTRFSMCGAHLFPIVQTYR